MTLTPEQYKRLAEFTAGYHRKIFRCGSDELIKFVIQSNDFLPVLLKALGEKQTETGGCPDWELQPGYARINFYDGTSKIKHTGLRDDPIGLEALILAVNEALEKGLL